MKRNHYIFSNGQLKRKDNTVYFINQKDEKKPLPIEKIENLYIFGEVTFNSKLLNYLSQYGICIHVYNYYGFYSGTYYPREKQVSGFLIIKQSEHYVDVIKRMFIAHQFISGAVHHIKRNLRRYGDVTKESLEKIVLLQKELSNARSVQFLMGLEGQIRQYYYQSFSSFLNGEFDFSKRSKQPPTDPINACISFGNTLMYREVLSQIYRTALNPTISYLHEPSEKRFSLSLDIAEIFKPLIIDPIIFSLINRNVLKRDDFDYLENRICYLNEMGKKKFLEAWEKRLSTSVKHRQLKRKTTYRYMIRLECYKLIKHFMEDEVYKPLKAWW